MLPILRRLRRHEPLLLPQQLHQLHAGAGAQAQRGAVLAVVPQQLIRNTWERRRLDALRLRQQPVAVLAPAAMVELVGGAFELPPAQVQVLEQGEEAGQPLDSPLTVSLRTDSAGPLKSVSTPVRTKLTLPMVIAIDG